MHGMEKKNMLNWNPIYVILGNIFLLLTYFVHKKPIQVIRFISRQKHVFKSAQLVALSVSFIVRVEMELSKKFLPKNSLEVRLIIDLSYNLPCLLGTVSLFVSYVACIHQLVTYRSQALSTQHFRRKKQVVSAVLFFTPITVVYLVNFGKPS
uniref:Serpentine receptor class gamma n=1 Tax=Steinernema glaseri TaxID=37863 RepID=A0A1I7YPZ9_9BILA